MMATNKTKLEEYLAQTLTRVATTPLEQFDKDQTLLNIWTLYKIRAWDLPAEAVAPTLKAYGSICKLINE